MSQFGKPVIPDEAAYGGLGRDDVLRHSTSKGKELSAELGATAFFDSGF